MEGRYWTNAVVFGDVPAERYCHVSWKANDRLMYVWGGVVSNPKGNEENVVYQFDTVSGLWSAIETKGKAPPLNTRMRGWSVYSGGHLYALSPSFEERESSCVVPQRTIKQCICYVLDTGTWLWTKHLTSFKEHIPDHLNGNSIAFYNNNIYCIGGFEDQPVTATTNVYFTGKFSILNTENWAWSADCPNCTVYSYNADAIVVGSKLIISGGLDRVFGNTKYYRNWDVMVMDFEIHPLAWEVLSFPSRSLSDNLLPYGREGHSLLYLGSENDEISFELGDHFWKSRLLSLGGVNTYQFLFNSHFLDLTGVTIENVESTKTQNLSFTTAQIIRGKVYAFGGMLNDRPSNFMQILHLLPTDTPSPPSAVVMEDHLFFTSPPPKEVHHSPTPPPSLGSALNNVNMFPDIEFCIGKTKIYAHKIFLYLYSSVFKQKFDEQQNRILELTQSNMEESEATEEEYSILMGEPVIEKVEVPNFWSPEHLFKLLKFMYTGVLRLESVNEAKAIGLMAYDYLIDSVMMLCNRSTTYPVTFEDDKTLRGSNIKKLLGKPIGSDISFIFNKKQRLFSHKIILMTTFSNFEELKDPKTKYIEVPPSITRSGFIAYMKFLYSNGDLSLVHIRDYPELIQVASHYKNLHLFDKLTSNIKIDNASTIHMIGFQSNLYAAYEAEQFILKNFGGVIQNDPNFKNHQKLISVLTDIFSGPYDSWCHIANWVDVLWFSSICSIEDLKVKTVELLIRSINTDNVVPILIAANSCQEKELRSVCIDYLVKVSAEPNHYKRVISSYTDYHKKGLSTSLKSEISSKVKNRVSTLLNDRSLPQPNIEVPFFDRGKHICSLCKRLQELRDIRTVNKLPPIFGPNTTRQVCTSCDYLITLIPS